MAKDRTAEIHRKTRETDIRLRVNLDGEGKYAGTVGQGFLDHMLELFATSTAAWTWKPTARATCTSTPIT